MQNNAEEDLLGPGLAESFGLLDADEELKEESKLQQLEAQNGEQYETPEKEKLLGGDEEEQKEAKQRKLPFIPKVTEMELNNPDIGLFKLAKKMRSIDRAPLRDDSRILEDICKAYEEWQISFCPRFEQYWFLQKVSDLGKKQSVQLHMEEIRRDYKGAVPLNQIIETEPFANYKFGKLQDPKPAEEIPQIETPVRQEEEQVVEKKKEESEVKIKRTTGNVLSKPVQCLALNASDIYGSAIDLYKDATSFISLEKQAEEDESRMLAEDDIPEGLFDDD